MMIVQENISETLVKTWSDAQLKIRKIDTDEIYDEAIDPIDMNRMYEETDLSIEIHEEPEELRQLEEPVQKQPEPGNVPQ